MVGISLPVGISRTRHHFDSCPSSGPIVRINPDNIHISDPDFYDVAYASNAPFEKMPKWRDRLGLPGATQSTIQHDLHRSRRMTLSPHFSKNIK